MLKRKHALYNRLIVGALVMAWLPLSCSNRQIYQAIQENSLRDCELIPYPQRSQCEKQYNKPYEEYERERKQQAAQ